MFVGVELECEGVDRPDMNLPGQQAQILKDAILYGTVVIKYFYSCLKGEYG